MNPDFRVQRHGKPAARSAVLPAVALLLLAGCVTPVSPAPRVAPGSMPAAQEARANHNLRVFDKAWDAVDRRYYDPKLHGVDWRTAAATYGPRATVAADDHALYTAINGLLGLLGDHHTGALTPVQARDFRTQARAMTGFRMLRIGERWVVDEALPGSPAEAAGVRRGWVVLSRDGQPLGEELKLPNLKGGEVVRWEFLDDRDRPVSLALTACRVSTARQESRILDGGVVWLRFDKFDFARMHWLSRELKSHRGAPAAIIDLRHNPGGLLVALNFVVGEFFDHGFSYAVSVDRTGRTRELKAILFGSARYAGKIAVLTDEASGSAAELFAAVIQEQRRGIVVGRKTGGDVLSARFVRLGDGGLLELSDRDLRTAGGRRLERNGVVPDVACAKPTLEEIRTGRDPDIEAALRALRNP